uniref:Uncharacterized protein n=1 Tax=Lygus hesperus TaxID=30085 RepID=A0A0A9Z0A5_LYGHE
MSLFSSSVFIQANSKADSSTSPIASTDTAVAMGKGGDLNIRAFQTTAATFSKPVSSAFVSSSSSSSTPFSTSASLHTRTWNSSSSSAFDSFTKNAMNMHAQDTRSLTFSGVTSHTPAMTTWPSSFVPQVTNASSPTRAADPAHSSLTPFSPVQSLRVAEGNSVLESTNPFAPRALSQPPYMA